MHWIGLMDNWMDTVSLLDEPCLGSRMREDYLLLKSYSTRSLWSQERIL
jgi:hypothetical protein